MKRARRLELSRKGFAGYTLPRFAARASERAAYNRSLLLTPARNSVGSIYRPAFALAAARAVGGFSIALLSSRRAIDRDPEVGAGGGDIYSLYTSAPRVRAWPRDVRVGLIRHYEIAARVASLCISRGVCIR